jgi:hypothetical protein
MFQTPVVALQWNFVDLRIWVPQFTVEHRTAERLRDFYVFGPRVYS